MTRAKASKYILHLRQLICAAFDILVAGDVVGHFAVVELAVGGHVEVSGADEFEGDVLGFAGFFANENKHKSNHLDATSPNLEHWF